MGTFTVAIEIAGSADGPFERLDALAGTGSSYALVPSAVLRRLGVEPMEMMPFSLDDGSLIEMPIGEAQVRLNGKRRTVVVVFGGAGNEAELGRVTLTAFGLELDPEHERCVPATLYQPTMIPVSDSEREAVG